MNEHRKREDSRAAHGVARWGQRRRGPSSLADRSDSSPRTSPMQDAIASREPLPFGRTSRMNPSRGASAERRANSVRRRPAPGLSTCGMPVFVAGKSSVFAYAVNSQSALRENAEDLADAEEFARALKKKLKAEKPRWVAGQKKEPGGCRPALCVSDLPISGPRTLSPVST
jgi:hypothetical protein